MRKIRSHALSGFVVLFALIYTGTLRADMYMHNLRGSGDRSAWSAVVQKNTNMLLRPGGSVVVTPRCLPTTSCEAQGKNCGSIPDGCGGTLTCGGCSGIDTCGGGGTANVCGQVCYKFGFIRDGSDGVSSLYEGGNCMDAPQDLTHVTTDETSLSNLTINPNGGLMGFQETYTSPEGIESSYMNTMGPGASSWGLFPSTAVTPLKLAWGPGQSVAFIARDSDGHEEIFLNRNVTEYYPPADNVLLRDMRGYTVKDIAWIPGSDGSPSHRLIIAATSTRFALETTLSILQLSDDYRSARLIPLEASTVGGTPSTIAGSQPTASRKGQRLMFVKKVAGRDRLYECDFDFSELDAAGGASMGRAYCPSPVEVSTTRDSPGDLASPCWSYDDHWLFYAWKAGGTSATWDIYRDQYVGDSFHREGLVVTSDADERELTCYPIFYTAVTTQRQSATIMPAQQQYQVVPTQQTYTVAPFRCDATHPCPSGLVCGTDQTCRRP